MGYQLISSTLLANHEIGASIVLSHFKSYDCSYNKKVHYYQIYFYENIYQFQPEACH